MKVRPTSSPLKKIVSDKKVVLTAECIDRQGQSEGFFTSFFHDPQNTHYSSGQSHLCPAKVEIFRQDTPAKAVYVVERGLVKLVRITSSGDEVIVGFRHRDSLIGAPPVFLDQHYSFSAITVLPTLLRSITKKVFLELVERNTQFSLQIHRLLSKNIYSQLKRIEETSVMSAEERLESLLSDMIRYQESIVSKTHDKFTLPLTNQELAQVLAISPEHLCRVLKEMEKKGLIRRNKGAIIVTNPQGFPEKFTD